MRETDEAFARDLHELRLWLDGSQPVNGHQGWQCRTLNFYWMDKFRAVAKEAERRLAEGSPEAAPVVQPIRDEPPSPPSREVTEHGGER